MADFIQKTDTLNQGREKLNAAITDAEKAKADAGSAVSTSNQAKQIAQTAEDKADSVQAQFDQVVIEGDSSVEAAQARVGADGNPYSTLKARLDAEHTQVTAQLTDVTSGVGGDNLIRNGDFSDGIRHWVTLTTPIKEADGIKYVSVGREWRVRWRSDKVEWNSKYTFSALARRTQAIPNTEEPTTMRVVFYQYDNAGNELVSESKYVAVTSARWRRYAVQIETLANTEYIEAVVMKSETEGMVLDFALFKFEWGVVPSDWTANTKESKETIETIEKNIPRYSLDSQFIVTSSIDGVTPGTMLPLEHRVHSGYAGFYPTEEFYGVIGGSVILKTTDGINFKKVADLNELYPGDSHFIVRQYTLRDGKRLLFSENPAGSKTGSILLVDNDYKNKKVGSSFNVLPYDIQGIDQHPFGGTVCYAEYNRDTDLTASVYRLNQYGLNTDVQFEKVFTVTAAGTTNSEIRHFHVVTPDPFVSGKWYLTSGDSAAQCSMWVSTDDALTWTKVVDGDVRMRSTMLSFGRVDRKIYWAEDNVGGGFYRMDPNTFEIETLVPKGIMKGSCYNATISPFGWVVHTHRDPATPNEPNYVYLIDHNFRVHTLMKTRADLQAFKSRMAGPVTGNIYSQTFLRDDMPNSYMQSRVLRSKIISNNDPDF